MDPTIVAAAASATAAAADAAWAAAKYGSELLTKQWLKERQKRADMNHEVEAMTSAVAIEVAALTDAVGRRYNWWTGLKKGDRIPEWLPPLVEFNTPAFDAIRDRIEKLPFDIVAAVVRFHGFLRFVNELQKTRAEYQQALRMSDFYGVYADSLFELMTIGVETMRDTFLKDDEELKKLVATLVEKRDEARHARDRLEAEQRKTGAITA
jgi:hypothetical protein